MLTPLRGPENVGRLIVHVQVTGNTGYQLLRRRICLLEVRPVRLQEFDKSGSPDFKPQRLMLIGHAATSLRHLGYAP